MRYQIKELFSLSILLIIHILSFIKTTQLVTVTTASVAFRGNQISSRGIRINRFLGVPYAIPPTGVLRFKRPVSCKELFTDSSGKPGTYDATHFCDSCIQDRLAGIVMRIVSRVKMSENCLCLNIWTPAKIGNTKLNDDGFSDPLPVLFYIHGGGFFYGSGATHTGSDLAAKGSVIVTINYRLGALGFFNAGNEESPGNQGLRDQVLALKWVNENIKYFGGDSERITIAGHSAGAISVSDLIASPQTSGLFSSAIIMSGSIFTVATFGSSNQLLDHSIELAIKLKCANEKARLEISDLVSKVKKSEEPLLGQDEGQRPSEGQGEVEGQIEEQVGLRNHTIECLRKLRPSKFVLAMKGSSKKYMKRMAGNPFKGIITFHPMGDDDLLPSHSPLELVNESMKDPTKRSLRLLIGTTDFEGGFFKLMPITRALANT